MHAFSDDAVMAGNGTIGLEILEDLPDVDAVVAPYGGGGLSLRDRLGAARGRARRCKVFAAEVATAAPLAASLEAGQPSKVEYTPSFVDGIGSPEVFPEMFELARELLDGSLVAELDEVADAVRLLAERARVVAEGAGATPLAVARSGRPAPARSSASSPAGTSTRRRWPRSWARNRASRSRPAIRPRSP